MTEEKKEPNYYFGESTVAYEMDKENKLVKKPAYKRKKWNKDGTPRLNKKNGVIR